MELDGSRRDDANGGPLSASLPSLRVRLLPSLRYPPGKERESPRQTLICSSFLCASFFSTTTTRTSTTPPSFCFLPARHALRTAFLPRRTLLDLLLPVLPSLKCSLYHLTLLHWLRSMPVKARLGKRASVLFAFASTSSLTCLCLALYRKLALGSAASLWWIKAPRQGKRVVWASRVAFTASPSVLLFCRSEAHLVVSSPLSSSDSEASSPPCG